MGFLEPRLWKTCMWRTVNGLWKDAAITWLFCMLLKFKAMVITWHCPVSKVHFCNFSVVPSFITQILQEFYSYSYLNCGILESSEEAAIWQPLPKYCCCLTKFSRKDMSPLVLKQKSLEPKHPFGDHTEIYTDGSLTTNGVSCATVSCYEVMQFKSGCIHLYCRNAYNYFRAEFYFANLYIVMNSSHRLCQFLTCC